MNQNENNETLVSSEELMENSEVELALMEEENTETIAMAISQEAFEEAMQNAVDIQEDSPAEDCICCPETNCEKWFRFVPSETKEYAILTTGNLNSKGEIYNAGMTLLASDRHRGIGQNFCMFATLESNNSYYIRVSSENNSVGCFTLKVKQAVHPMILKIDRVVLGLQKDQEGYLFPTVLPADASCKDVVWQSSNTDVAIVDPSFNGSNIGDANSMQLTSGGCRVTAVANGTAYVTATTADGEKVARCRVNVGSTIKDNVEYHLLCNGENSKALRIGRANVFELKSDLPVRGERKSYWMRQKWVLRSEGDSKKLFTQLDNNYYLCNNGSNDGYVSNSASDANSSIVVLPCANSSELYEIKLANSNLYLTLEYNSSDQVYWAKWRVKSAANVSNQVWKFVEQPANLHNGVDTGTILNESYIQSLKSEDTEFVIRYYKLLVWLKGVNLKTLDDPLKPTSTPAIDETIALLQTKNIDLDVENYLEYADTISLSEYTLYITGNGKSLLPDEKDRYLTNNINIVSVYQNAGDNYEYFTEKHAKLDALCALLSAKKLGQPYGTTIYFAVDFDIDGGSDEDAEGNAKIKRIKTYFDIVKNKIGGRYQIGVYGSGYVCSAIKPSYAQYSWLKNSIDHEGYEDYDDPTKYNIKQAETYSCGDIGFDDDVAVGNDYGQWYV